MLEPGVILGVAAPVRSQARVELQRVGRDRDGILAPAPQLLGQRDRDRGLATPSGPKSGRAAGRQAGTDAGRAAARRVRSVSRMGVRIGTGPLDAGRPPLGAIEAAGAARDALGGRACDLGWCSPGRGPPGAGGDARGAPREARPRRAGRLRGRGVIGESREVEEGTAVAVWAAALDGGEATSFHAEVEPVGADRAC